ncbi:TPA: AI-2E family transporter [Streptococcus suis]
MKYLDKKAIYYILFTAFVVLCVIYWQSVMSFAGSIWSASSAVVMAAIYAYVLNILMSRFEKWLFNNPDNKFHRKYGRGLSIFLSLLTILAVVVLVLVLVLPQLISLVTTMIDAIPQVIFRTQQWVDNEEALIPFVNDLADRLNVNWAELGRRAINYINAFTQSFVGQGVQFLGTAFSSTMSFILSLMLAIYFLISKETLARQFRRLTDVYLPGKWVHRIRYVLNEFNNAFENFITGEVLEALILGSLVAVGMFIIRLPYAAMIGVVTGVLALIPLIGAYVSAAIGFVLILAQSPVKALIFLVFITVIQQLEGNFIYPKVVGNSIGLPGMWVLVAVTIGGGVYGIPGMLLGVPLAAALYSIIKTDVEVREQNQALTSPASQVDPETGEAISGPAIRLD